MNFDTMEPDWVSWSQYTGSRGGHKIDKIVIHHNAGVLSLQRCLDVLNGQGLSVHYQVDSQGRVAQYVRDEDLAYHAHDYGNQTGIGIEHSNAHTQTDAPTDDCIDAGAHLTAALCKKHNLGEPEWYKNVFPHRDVPGNATECPGELHPKTGSKGRLYIQKAKAYYNGMGGGGTILPGNRIAAAAVAIAGGYRDGKKDIPSACKTGSRGSHGSRIRPPSDGDYGTFLYIKPKLNRWGSLNWACCDCCATTAVLWSGADDGFPDGWPGVTKCAHYMINSDKWDYKGMFHVGMRADGSNDGMQEVAVQPGDLLVRKSNYDYAKAGHSGGNPATGGHHIRVFVGRDAANLRFPGCNCTYAEADYGKAWPHLSSYHPKSGDAYAVFRRNTKSYNPEKSRYYKYTARFQSYIIGGGSTSGGDLLQLEPYSRENELVTEWGYVSKVKKGANIGKELKAQKKKTPNTISSPNMNDMLLDLFDMFGIPLSSEAAGTGNGLTGSSNEEKVYNYLVGAGLSKAGACGIMGNIGGQEDTGYDPKQAQIGSTNLSNEEYTKRADNGTIDFVNDQCGYGLVQWTSPGRKQLLLDEAKKRHTSVGDLELQLSVIIIELKEYGDLYNFLKTSDDPYKCAERFMLEYERPNLSLASVSARGDEAKRLYAKYAK